MVLSSVTMLVGVLEGVELYEDEKKVIYPMLMMIGIDDEEGGDKN